MGLVLGVIRMILDFTFTEPQCGEQDTRPAVVKDIHYLYFSMILSTVTLATLCAVSWLTEPPPEDKVRLGLTPDAETLGFTWREKGPARLEREGGLPRKPKSRAAVRDSRTSGRGQTHPHPPLAPLLCWGPAQGQQLPRTRPLIRPPNAQTFPPSVPSRVPGSH